QPDGRLLIVENPTSPVSQLTRLNSDLTVDTSFTTGTGANGLINDLAITPDNKIIAAGDFTEYNGTPQNGVVKLDANGLLDLLWNPGNGANGSIRTVSVNEKGEIFVGGDFTVYNGQTATRIAKLDTNGVLDDIFSAFGGANGTVNDVLVQGNGQIAVAGDFTQLGGWTTDHFGRLNQDGSPDTGFDTSTGANNSIYDIASAPDGKLYIGGRFTSVQGVSCPKIARLNADGTVDTTFNPGLGPDDDVEALAVQPNGQVIAVGMFENVGTEAYHGYARYNTDGHLDTNWGFGSAGANFAVYDVLPQPDGKTLLAGWFTSLNGHSANFIGLLGASGYYDPSFNSGTGFNDAVYTLEQAPNGNVFVGGRFTSYNSLSAGRIVSITPNGTRDASFFTGTGFNSNVWAFANAPDGKLYVGGDFSSFNGTPANRITRHNSDGSLDTTFDVGTGPNSRVSFLSTHADKLYVGGSFTEFNGEPHYRFVRLNADGSVDDNFDIGAGANNGVLAGVVQPDDNKVVMVGNFTQFDNQPANYLTRLNGATMPSFTNEPPDLTVNLGDAVNSPLAATGIPSPTFGIVPSGTVGTESTPTQILTTTNGLPPGLTLSESGVISGTATTAGIYTFTVRVSNYVAPSAYQTMTISIVEAGENKIYLPLVTK
ncbi:MAG: putative Ig domain-containing protein, partial [Chloroflexota bacterium]